MAKTIEIFDRVSDAESLMLNVAKYDGLLANSAPVIQPSRILSFAARVDYAVGAYAQSLTTADIDGDGRLDIVTSNSDNKTVSVLFNNGDGFATAVVYAVGEPPRSVAAADVNGDGYTDLVVGNSSNTSLTVLLNDGTGAFTEHKDYAIGGNSLSVAVADINGDGKADIIDLISTVNGPHTPPPGFLSILLNDGAGIFADPDFYATGFSQSVVVEDVTGDGIADIVVRNYGYYSNGSFSVWLNNGDGTFAPTTSYLFDSFVSYSDTLAAVDFNGDGKSDIILAGRDYSKNSGVVSIFLNNGDGTFAPKTDYAYTTNNSSYSTFVSTTDLNGDGDADIILTSMDYSTNTSKLSVLLNNGDGTFAESKDYNTGGTTSAVTSADLNGDGLADIVVTGSDATGSFVSVLQNSSEHVPTAYIEQTPVSVFGHIFINDPDGDASWNGGSLLVQITSNADAVDSLSLAATDSGSNSIWLDADGYKLMAGSIQIGTASAMSVSSSDAWTMTFNEQATNALVESVGRAIMFNNSDTLSSDAQRGITLTVSDNEGASATLVETVVIAPSLSSATPADDATAVAVDSNIMLTFNKVVEAGTGSIVISSGSGDSFTIDVADSSQVTFSGSTVTINPATDLQAGKVYHVQMSSGVIKDLAGTAYAGISDATTLNFATVPNKVNSNGQPLYNYNGHTYQFTSNGLLTWDQAEAEAIVHGGHLVTINDAEENQWLSSAIGQLSTWIGLNDIQKEGEWVWVDGSAITYTNWSYGEPNDQGSEDFGSISANSAGMWNDLSVYSQLYGIIEYPSLVIVPTLTTFRGVAGTTSEDTETKITFVDLLAQGDAADADGVVEAFVVKSPNGTLRIGSDAATASAWDAFANNTIDATHHAWWRPAANANGTLDAFSVVARDNDGAESITAVNATAEVTPVQDAPVIVPSQTLSFAEKVDYIVGYSSNELFTTDLNGDGKADIVLRNSAGISVLLNNGDGTFAPTKDYATDVYPASVTTADLNGDGKADIIMSYVNSDRPGGSVAVLMSNSEGTFAPKTEYSTGYYTYPSAVTTADVNGDGQTDLVVTGADSFSNAGIVSIWLNNDEGVFTSAADYAIPNSAQLVMVTDLNSDGMVDIVTKDLGVDSTGSYSISVLMNKGDGTFTPKTDYPLTGDIRSIAVIDLNGDDKADLIVTGMDYSTFHSKLSVLMNNGDGTFGPQKDYAMDGSLNAVTTADLNGDDKADLIVTGMDYSTFHSKLSVLMNNGDGSFAPQQEYVIATNIQSVTVNDLNGDGNADIIVTGSYDYYNNTSKVSVLLNKGDGSFAQKTDYAIDGSLNTVTDLNGDGKADLIVRGMNHSNNIGKVSVLLNNGDGTFTFEKEYAIATIIQSVTISDLNSDGDADIIVMGMDYSNNTNKISVLLNTSQKTVFIEQTPVSAFGNIIITDPDGEGEWKGGSLSVQITANADTADSLSITTTNPGSNGIWLDVNGNKLMAGSIQIGTANAASVSNGTGWTFSLNEQATNELVQSVGRAIMFNNSSDTPSIDERSITLTVNDSHGASTIQVQPITIIPVNELPTFTSNSNPVATTAEETAVEITVADLLAKGNSADVDGTIDGFFVQHLSSGTLKIGSDAAIAMPYNENNYTIDAIHHAWWTPDMNANGTLEAFTIVARDNDGGTSATAVQATVAVIPVNDAPVITVPQSFAAKVDYAVTGYLQTVTDLNGDGKADLLLMGVDYANNSGNVSVLMNKGDGTFAPKVDYAVTGYPNSVTIVDLNGDGNADIILRGVNSVTYATDKVSVLINKGDGTFAAKVDFVMAGSLHTVTDLNGDGKADFIWKGVDYATGNGKVSILMSKGDGTFAEKVDYATGGALNTVTDLNGDGADDLIATGMDYSNNTSKVSVLLNKGDGTFAAKVDYAIDGSLSSVTDLNGDGMADIIVTGMDYATGSGKVSVLLNKGDGTFAAKADYATNSTPNPVTTTDINGDGKADLILMGMDSVSVLLNKGDGAFAAKADYATNSAPNIVTTTDINGDGKGDIIVTSLDYAISKISVLLNNGDGTFAPKTDYVIGDYGASPSFFTVVDLNGDGYKDILYKLSNWQEPDRIVALLNNGHGAFDEKIAYTSGGDFSSLTTADLNNDGIADIIGTSMDFSSNTGKVSVLMNTSHPPISFTEQTPLLLFSNISITEPDGTTAWNGSSLTVQITANAEAADHLTLPTTNPGNSAIWLDTNGKKLMAGTIIIGKAYAASVSGDTLWQFTFNSNASNELVQSVVHALTFSNNSDAPLSLPRTVTLAATDDLGASASRDQNIIIKEVNDTPAGSVTITGTPTKGQTLTAHHTLADADGLGNIHYQWKAGGVDISGATGSSYTLSQAELGKTITVSASYIDGQGSNESVISAATLLAASLSGTAGADVLNGGSTSDWLSALAGNDKLNGNAGDDTLDGGAGADTLVGGAGDDTYIIDRTSDKVTEIAGEGTDLVQVNIAAAGGTYTVANNVEHATLVNSVAFNLTGNALANMLTGNAEANVLDGGAGSDTLIGGEGNDTYMVDHAGDLVVEAADAGTDLVKVTIATAGSSYTLTDNVENATLQNTVAFNLNGNALGNTLIGNGAANTLTGAGGNDTMTGGLGIDTFNVDSGTDTITDLGKGGGDILMVSEGATANATVSALWTATSATSNHGTANITTNGLGVNLAAVVTGNGYHVTNTGQGTTVTGSGLADVLSGGTSIDTLIGGNGNDVLNGGNGNDALTGGAGSDIFQFSTTPGRYNRDVIADFQSGSDKIELLATLFANVKGGDLTKWLGGHGAGIGGLATLFANVKGGDGVFNGSDILIGAGVTKGTAAGDEHLIFNTTNHALSYDADGGGAGVAVQFATLTGVVTLLDTDFMLY